MLSYRTTTRLVLRLLLLLLLLLLRVMVMMMAVGLPVRAFTQRKMQTCQLQTTRARTVPRTPMTSLLVSRSHHSHSQMRNEPASSAVAAAEEGAWVWVWCSVQSATGTPRFFALTTRCRCGWCSRDGRGCCPRSTRISRWKA
jgi:hypothetical protein